MVENIPQVTSLMSKMSLFKGLSQPQLEDIARRFTMVELKNEELLFRQGEKGTNFCIIFSGSLKVSRETGGKHRDLAILGPGDYVGEESLLYGRPRVASVLAGEDSHLLRLGKDQFDQVLRDYPQIKQYLIATVKTRRLSRRKRLYWLGEDETVYLMAKRHPAILLVSMIAPLIVGWLSILFFYLAYRVDAASFHLVLEWTGGLVLLAAAVWSAWLYIDWGNDYYIVTNQRVIWLEKVVGIYDSRQEAPLSTVLTVGVQTDQIGRMLGYGDVIVRTYTGQIRMENVGYPSQLASLVDELLERSKQSVRKAETEALEQAIRQRLGLKVEEKPKKDVVPPATFKPIRHSHPVKNLLTEFFVVRFEEGGVITFRKHWILLIYRIWLPTLLILSLFIAIGARLAGLYTFFSTTLILVVGLTLLPILFGAWLYQYIDWRNDIYQVTHEQIIDIYKKPLGREDKKSALLENILSLQHTRNGIVGLVLNYGDVTAMVGAARFVFEGVYDPASVEQEIFHRINMRKRSQKEAEATRERERIADWLAAYHRQSESLRRSENPPNFDRNSG